MAYSIVDMPSFNAGNLIVPPYKKVIRDDGSYYYLGWRTILPDVIAPNYFWRPEFRGYTTPRVIANTDGRSTVMSYFGGTISGANSMYMLYKNPQNLVPFGVNLQSTHWRDGGGIQIQSALGYHVYIDTGGSAAHYWDGNVVTQLDIRISDRKFMLELNPEAWFFCYARRHDIHNDDWIHYECAMSLQQYWSPEEFYMLYGVNY